MEKDGCDVACYLRMRSLGRYWLMPSDESLPRLMKLQQQPASFLKVN